MSKLSINFRNKSIEWHVIKFNALRDRHRKVCEPQLDKHSWYVLEMAVQFSSVAQSCPTLCNPMDCMLWRWDVHPFSLVAPHCLLCLSSIPDLSASFSLADIHCSFWFIGSEGRIHFPWGLGEKKDRDGGDSCQFPISGVDTLVQIPGQALSSAPGNLAAERSKLLLLSGNHQMPQRTVLTWVISPP